MPVNLDRALAVLREHRLDAVISMAPENLTYLADFPAFSDWESAPRVYAILPAGQDARASLVVPRDAVDLLAASGAAIDGVWLYGEGVLHEAEGWEATDPEEERVRQALRRPHHRLDQEALVACLKAAGLDRGRLGFDEKVLPSPQLVERVKALLPGAEVLPASRILRRMRMVKSEEEVARLRAAAAANEAAITAALGAARTDAPETELASHYYAALRQHGAVPRQLSLTSGRRAALPNAQASGRRLQPGDVVRVDADCVRQGYYSDLGRCGVLGDPGPRLSRCHAAAVAGLEAAVAALRPGATAAAVFRTAVAAVQRAGIPHYQRHHVGHALGCVGYDDPLIGPKDETTLEPGMVINLQTPYYELGLGGTHVEATFLVTATACEPLVPLRTALQPLP
jgi:Xaa-Pro aminopeptidase